MLIAQGILNNDCLAGKTAIVSGAGSGIGFEAGQHPDGEQSPVAIAAQTLPHIEAVRRMLEKQVSDWKQRPLFEQQ